MSLIRCGKGASCGSMWLHNEKRKMRRWRKICKNIFICFESTLPFSLLIYFLMKVIQSNNFLRFIIKFFTFAYNKLYSCIEVCDDALQKTIHMVKYFSIWFMNNFELFIRKIVPVRFWRKIWQTSQTAISTMPFHLKKATEQQH